MPARNDTTQTPAARPPNPRAVGFVVACLMSLFLHALALGAVVIYWADWFGVDDGTRVPEMQSIVVLGNVGGSAGSVKGNPEGDNEPTPLPPNTPPEAIKPAPPRPAAPPIVTVDDVKRTVAEAQQWLARTTPQLPNFSKFDVTIEIPPLPTKVVADAWQKAADWTAEQFPKLKTPEPKKVKQEPPPKPEPPMPVIPEKKQPEGKKQESPRPPDQPTTNNAPKQEPSPTPARPAASQRKGNADGNNRGGSGNVGSGGNNDGEDARARLHESNVAPPYPYEAARLNIEFTVKVLVEYQADGNVTRVSLDTSSGSSLLDDPIVDHVRRTWRKVHPRKVRGRPTAGSFIHEFIYRIK